MITKWKNWNLSVKLEDYTMAQWKQSCEILSKHKNTTYKSENTGQKKKMLEREINSNKSIYWKMFLNEI